MLEIQEGCLVLREFARHDALYADRCILKKKSAVNRIMKEMCLPAAETVAGTDGPGGHYKCAKCLKGTHAREDDF